MNQLSFLCSDGALDEARLHRDAGMSAALAHAEETTPTWGAIALTFLRRYALREPEFAIYMVVMASENDRGFPEPPTTRAWGQVVRAAVMNGWIENTGRSIQHPRRHASPAIVWKSLIYGRAT